MCRLLSRWSSLACNPSFHSSDYETWGRQHQAWHKCINQGCWTLTVGWVNNTGSGGHCGQTGSGTARPCTRAWDFLGSVECTPVIPVSGRVRQKHCEFETNLTYRVRLSHHPPHKTSLWLLQNTEQTKTPMINKRFFIYSIEQWLQLNRSIRSQIVSQTLWVNKEPIWVFMYIWKVSGQYCCITHTGRSRKNQRM